MPTTETAMNSSPAVSSFPPPSRTSNPRAMRATTTGTTTRKRVRTTVPKTGTRTAGALLTATGASTGPHKAHCAVANLQAAPAHGRSHIGGPDQGYDEADEKEQAKEQPLQYRPDQARSLLLRTQ